MQAIRHPPQTSTVWGPCCVGWLKVQANFLGRSMLLTWQGYCSQRLPPHGGVREFLGPLQTVSSEGRCCTQ